MKKRVILASGSPRRKELMKMITDSFEVHVSDCEEIITSDVPSEVTKELAKQKAEAVFKEILQKEKEFLVIASSLIVFRASVETCNIFAILSSISSSICSFCSNFENACCVMFNSAARVSCLIPSISRMRFILCPWCVLLIGIVSVLIVVLYSVIRANIRNNCLLWVVNYTISGVIYKD